jgi:hypothetical protein
MKARIKGMKSLQEPARKPEKVSESPTKQEPHYPRVELSADQLGTVLEGKRVGQKHMLVFQGVVDKVRTSDSFERHPKGTELVTFNLTHGCIYPEAKKDGKSPKTGWICGDAAREAIEEGKENETRSRITSKMKAYK